MGLTLSGFGAPIAADQISIPGGTPPSSGQRVVFVKIDAGSPGNSAPVGPDNPLPVSINPGASVGSQVYRSINVSTGALIYSSSTQLLGYIITNQNQSSTRYVRFYNSAAQPTLGTTSVYLTFAIPAASAANVNFSPGIAFSNGMGIAASGGVADNDTTAISANDIVANVFYLGDYATWQLLSSFIWADWNTKTWSQ
jgi:hypothetical protein